MADQGTSFIPKSGARAVTRTRVTHRIYILSYVSYVVFFGTLFAVAGVYLYTSNIQRSLEGIKSQLIAERARFSSDEIENIKSLDRRLNTANQLLTESSAPSKLFADIEAIAASNVNFSGMKYAYLGNLRYELEITGQADEFNQVVWQRELLKNSPILQKATVSKYDYSVNGNDGQVSGDSVLTFLITDTSSTNSIPYTPDVEATSETVEINADTQGVNGGGGS